METGVRLITRERQRQVEEEGWTADHDDGFGYQLAVMAASYILDIAGKHSSEHESWRKKYSEYANEIFPFDREDWRKLTPHDPIRQLTKAGALIAAEIDRLLRMIPFDSITTYSMGILNNRSDVIGMLETSDRRLKVEMKDKSIHYFREVVPNHWRLLG